MHMEKNPKFYTKSPIRKNIKLHLPIIGHIYVSPLLEPKVPGIPSEVPGPTSCLGTVGIL